MLFRFCFFFTVPCMCLFCDVFLFTRFWLVAFVCFVLLVFVFVMPFLPSVFSKLRCPLFPLLVACLFAFVWLVSF